MVLRSPLAAFTAAAAARASEGQAEELQRELSAHAEVAGGELDQTRAVLSAAANALRRSLGNEGQVTIGSGDAAFDELQILQSNALGAPYAEAAHELSKALDLATERLGPFSGGRLGQFRHPTQEPPTVDEIEPTASELVEMAEHAGHTVGILGAADRSNPGEVLRSILNQPMV